MKRFFFPITILIIATVISCAEAPEPEITWDIHGHEIRWVYSEQYGAVNQADKKLAQSSDFSNRVEETLKRKIETVLTQGSNSVIAKINNSDTGELVDAGDAFEEIRGLLGYSNECFGAFDPTLQILWDVYEFESGGRYVSDDELADALRWVNYRMIEIEGTSVIRKGDFTRIGFGPTISGLIVDSAISLLKNEGASGGVVISDYCYTALDDGHTYDFMYPLKKSGDEQLQMNYGHFKLEPGQFVAAFDDSLKGFFAHGKYFHMVLSPLDGRPVQSVRAVVVVSNESCLQATVFAYAVMVMGENRGIEFLNETDGVEGIILTADHDVIV
ncbi:MAG TPA: hypothetical protein ENN67_04400, partial [Firmicutes bacterium]|nr:hypothetical protein [Bacillota bacterium]